MYLIKAECGRDKASGGEAYQKVKFGSKVRWDLYEIFLEPSIAGQCNQTNYTGSPKKM